jgi:hypothetical protein
MQAGAPEEGGAAAGSTATAEAARLSATRIRRVLALLMLLVSAFLLYASGDIAVGTSARPGPGLMPRLVAGGLALAALLALVERVGRGAEVEDAPDRPGLRRQGLVLASVVAFIVAIPVVGFLVSAALSMTTTSWVISAKRRILRAAVIGTSIAVVVDGTFRFFLNVNLPSGLWGIGLG